MNRVRTSWLIAALMLIAPTVSAQNEGDRRGRASATDLRAHVEQLAQQVKVAEDNLRVVETQYSARSEPTGEETLLKRFSDGEIQYLLGDFRSASVLFYDLVSDRTFRKSEKLADALFYLADALYQQHNDIGARLYLRELLGLKSRHYPEALSRYLEIAGRLNEFEGIDDYIQQARGLSGGNLSPELAYVYGKWLFKRTDLPKAERLERAREVFLPLARAEGPLRMQAAYFLAVADLQEKNYGDAIDTLERIAAQPTDVPREKKVKELANLSLGRVLYEVGRYDEALDRYQEIPRDSEHFVETLYEIAWVHVRKGEHEKAKNATDILLLVSPDSLIAPDARILQGHLLLKLARYEEATDTYNQVINEYAPVRDEVDALLTVNKDPVAYFDDLLARNDRNLDVAELLPAVALKWATTQREVADAVRIVDDLENGRRGVAEGRELAARIVKALDERGLETFPELQEGYLRADAVDSSLTRAEEALVRIEAHLVRDHLGPEEVQELERIRLEKAELEKKFSDLPKTVAEVEARRKRLQQRVDAADRQAFKLGYEVQSMYAVLSAMDKWVADTRSQRKNTPEEEKAFLSRLQEELRTLEQLEAELATVRQTLADERETAAAFIGGEDAIRRQYGEMLEREHALVAKVESKLGGDFLQVMKRAHEVRVHIGEVRGRLTSSKDVIRAQVRRRGEEIRDKVEAEQRLLEAYAQEVDSVSGDARNLVGRIAFDSFRRVRQQFYDLVLKADVGVVDVAFTRKQDKTSQIQDLAQKKDRELRALDEEFKEVLEEVD